MARKGAGTTDESVSVHSRAKFLERRPQGVIGEQMANMLISSVALKSCTVISRPEPNRSRARINGGDAEVESHRGKAKVGLPGPLTADYPPLKSAVPRHHS